MAGDDSLATSSSQVLQELGSLVTTLGTTPRFNQHHAKLEDVLQRFKLWAGNIGALHGPESHKSLDHRVRHSPMLKTRFAQLLTDMHDDLEEYISLPKTNIGSTNIENAESEAALDNLVEFLSESIGWLFKTSGIARKAVARDRYALALNTISTSQVRSEEVDFDLIGDLFPRLRLSNNDWLRQRLARANNQRRRYLQWCEHHQKSIQAGNDRKQEELDQTKRNPPAQLDDARTETSSQFAGSTATTVKAAMLEDHQLEVDDADSVISTFSYTTDSATPMRYKVIDLQEVSDGRDEFICPYCRKELFCTSQGLWQKHVLSDIKAYVCLDKDCDTQLFEDSRSWISHQTSKHSTHRVCLYCPDGQSYGELEAFQTHLRQAHGSKFEEKQLAEICKISEQIPKFVSVSECMFCNWGDKLRYSVPSHNRISGSTVSFQRYRRHISAHMEQAALAILGVEATDQQEDYTSQHDSDEAIDHEPDLGWMLNSDAGQSIPQISGNSVNVESPVQTPVTHEEQKASNMREAKELDEGPRTEKETPQSKQLSMLKTVTSLGELYAGRGMDKEAEGMFLRALNGYKEVLGPNDASTVETMIKLGGVFKNQGKLLEAECMYLEAVIGYEEALGPKHITVLNTVNNAAVFYADQGRTEAAETLFSRALKGYEEILGPKHQMTLEAMNNLGSVYKEQGKLVEAEDMYLRALMGYEES